MTTWLERLSDDTYPGDGFYGEEASGYWWVNVDEETGVAYSFWDNNGPSFPYDELPRAP